MNTQERFKSFEKALSELIVEHFGSRITGVLKDSISVDVGSAKVDPSWNPSLIMRDIEIRMKVVCPNEDMKQILDNNEPFSIEKHF